MPDRLSPTAEHAPRLTVIRGGRPRNALERALSDEEAIDAIAEVLERTARAKETRGRPTLRLERGGTHG